MGVGVGGASIGSSEKRMEQELIGLGQKRGDGQKNDLTAPLKELSGPPRALVLNYRSRKKKKKS